MVPAPSEDTGQPQTISTALLVGMPTENELGIMRKQILKCKLYVGIFLYTVYATSHHSKALAIFGFSLQTSIHGVMLPTGYYFMKKTLPEYIFSITWIFYIDFFTLEKRIMTKSLQHFPL